MSGDAEVETARECIAQKEDTGALAKLKTLAGPQTFEPVHSDPSLRGTSLCTRDSTHSVLTLIISRFDRPATICI